MSFEWAQKTLDDVCLKITDGAHNSPKSVVVGKPMASVKDLTTYGVDLSEARQIAIEDFETLVNQGCKPEIGDVLIAKDGNSALDTVCNIKTPLEAVLLSSVAILRPDPKKINSDFLKYYFSSRATIEYLKGNFISGAAIPRVVLKDFKKAKINLPPLKVQEDIANVLNSLDLKIELNRQTNQTLEQIAQAIFKSWFVDFEPVKAKQHIRTLGGNDEQSERAAQAVIAGAVNLDVITTATDLSALDQQLTQALSEKLAHQTAAQREQLDTTASHFPDQLVESELGLIPEGWEVGALKDCCLRVESGGTPKRSESDFWNGNIRWLSSGEVRNLIILDTKEKITGAGLKNSSAKLWPSGSIVVAMYGATAGQICLLAKEMTANQACCALIPKKHYQNFIFLSARRSLESLSGKASGSAQQNLNKSLVAEHRVLISPEKVLEAFETFTSSFLGGWIKIMEQNAVLSELRDSILPKLLSGELAPNQSR